MTYFRQIYDEGLAQAAYIVGDASSGKAVVVDPLRDIDQYLDHLNDRGYELAGVLETHIHADFLSGGRELAHATGAPLYISAETVEGWKYKGLEGLDVVEMNDGDVLTMGDVEIEAVHTPGHTPEHLSFLVRDTGQTASPMLFLTGDFAFVGDLGRPDLLEEAAGEADTARPGGLQLFDAVDERLLELPDHVQIWPGHGSGSACGKALGDVPSSTVGYEREGAWWATYFQREEGKEAFVDELLDGQPPSPTYFKQMKLLNRDGPAILGRLPEVPRLMPKRAQEAIDEGALVLDLRDLKSFAQGHIKGAVNLPSLKNLSNHAGWVVPYDRELLLVARPEEVDEAMRRLIRIGLDDLVGYIPANRLAQTVDGELRQFEVVEDPDELYAYWKEADVQVVDARSPKEYEAGRIPKAIEGYYGRLPSHLDEVAKDKPIITHCEAGTRAAIAASLMGAEIDEVITIFTGGFRGWKNAGLPVEE